MNIQLNFVIAKYFIKPPFCKTQIGYHTFFINKFKSFQVLLDILNYVALKQILEIIIQTVYILRIHNKDLVLLVITGNNIFHPPTSARIIIDQRHITVNHMEIITEILAL